MVLNVVILIPFLVLLPQIPRIHADYKELVCESAIAPENGRLTMTDRDVGGVADISCNDGFWLVGASQWVCTHDGRWEGEESSCEPVRCLELPDPPHGKMQYSGNGFMDTAYVKCDTGYIYSNPRSNNRICQKDNIWSSGSGICDVVNCSRPAIPRNGHLEMLSWHVNSTVRFSCNEGYRYNGTETRMCQPDGKWTGKTGHCKEILCVVTPRVENGKVFITARTYKSTISFNCTSGYVLHGSAEMTCQTNGLWSEQKGGCRMEQEHGFLIGLIPLLVISVIVMVALIATSIGCLLWRNQRRSERRTEAQEDGEALICDTVYHCSFIFEEPFKAGQSNQHSEEYIAFTAELIDWIKTAMNDSTGKPCVELVSVKGISQDKQMVFVDIQCKGLVTNKEITRALMLPRKGIQICQDSLRFRDSVSSALALDIIKKNHVQEEGEDMKIDLDTQYIELKIISMSIMATIQTEETEIPDRYQADLENTDGKVISDDKIINQGKEKYIMIRGRAGIGKTTLIQRLMWRWAHHEWGTHLKAFFLLNLRMLMTITTKMTFPEFLTQYAVYKTEGTAIVQEPWLNENQRAIGLVLDGIDEVSNFKDLWLADHDIDNLLVEEEPLFWGFALMKRKCLRKCTLIVVSRPFAALSYITSDKMVEVMGLTRNRVMEFVDKNVKPERIESVKDTLRKRLILLSVASITFYCAALCRVLQGDNKGTDHLTTYTQITAYILKMFVTRSVKGPHVALKEVYTSLRSLCQLAYDGLIRRTDRGMAQLVFDMDNDRTNVADKDISMARRAGIFMQTEIKDLTRTKRLGEFVHLSVQEFLAMAGLLTKEPTEFKHSLTVLLESGHFTMSLLFLCGFAFNTRNSTVQDLCAAITGRSKPMDEICNVLKKSICDRGVVSDDLQALQMIHESQETDIAKEAAQGRFCDGVTISNTKLTVVDILAIAFLVKHHASPTLISLNSVGLDAICVNELTQFLKANGTVGILRLHDNGMDDVSMVDLAELVKENKSLTSLTINSEGITDKGLVCLADALKTNTTLQQLIIMSTKVADNGVAALAEALEKGTSLTHLEFWHVTMEQSRIKSIAAALRSTKTLQQFTIGGHNVDKKGVKTLAAIVGASRTITYLGLPNTKVTDAGAKALLQALDDNPTVNVSIAKPKCRKELKEQLAKHDRIIGSWTNPDDSTDDPQPDQNMTQNEVDVPTDQPQDIPATESGSQR